MTTPYSIAQDYIGRGWKPIPVPHRSKGPALKDWQHLRLTAADLPQHFNGQPQNVGVLLGEPSGGLVDIDCDWPESESAAPRFLPVTASLFGRKSKPEGHRLYYTGPIPKTEKWRDPTAQDGAKGTIVELRSTGVQTVFPGSTHPTGEAIVWQQDSTPAHVDAVALRAAVARLAACCILARHWPRGARWEAALALSGALLRAGWPTADVEHFVRAVAETAGDEETAQRVSGVAATVRRLQDGGQATGWPRLAHLVSDAVAGKAAAWLGLSFTHISADVPADRERTGSSNGDGAPHDAAPSWPEPEDRGTAALTDQGNIEYIEDLIRPGRITVLAAEEGTGKSFAAAGELAIRLSVAGGDFAGTWPVHQQAPVLLLSEMHTDDDYQREETVLAALGHARGDLAGRYYRLGLMTGEKPLLVQPEWRTYITAWMQTRGVLLLIVDTVTSATGGIDPWGPHIQEVFRGLRQMQEMHPALAVLLCVHLKKPQGRGERRISDVLGEWGRWCDVLLLLENDGSRLDRAKLTARKRVRQERRILVDKRDGLLVDPQDLNAGAQKVPLEKVVAAIRDNPGVSLSQLAATLKVSRATATKYSAAAQQRGDVEQREGANGAILLYPTGYLSTPVNTEDDMTGSRSRAD